MAVELRAVDDEQNLIDAAQAGEVEAFARLYERYRDALFGICLARLKDPALAEDTVQDTFLKAFINLPRFEAGSKFWSWLVTIAVRRCIDVQRYRVRSYVTENPEAERTSHRSQADTTLDEVIAAENRIDIQHALAALSPRQRRALLLYAVEGWSYSAIASAENVSIGAVNSLLVRARRAIRAACEAGPFSVLVPVFHKMHWRLRASFYRLRSSVPQSVRENLIWNVQALMVGTFALTTILSGAPDSAGGPVQTPSTEQGFAEISTKNESVAPMPHASSTQSEQQIDRPPVIDSSESLVDKVLDRGAGETPESTKFRSTVVSPDYERDHTIFAAGDCGSGTNADLNSQGLNCRVMFVSTDGGGTWERLPARALLSDFILLSPSYPADPRMFMFGPAGLQESTDRGQSFQMISPLARAAAISPALGKSDSRILMDTGTPNGTLLEYWTDQKLVKPSPLTTSRPLNTYLADISFSPGYFARHPVVLFAGQSENRTTGSRWLVQTMYQSLLHRCEELVCTEVHIPGHGDAEMRISPNFAEDGTVYAFTSDSVVVYDDPSRTIRSLRRPGGSTIQDRGSFIQDLAVSWRSPGPVRPMFAATSTNFLPGGLYRSLDGGDSWTKLPLDLSGFKDNISGVVVTPTGRLLVSSNKRGIACSEDGGQTWAHRCTPES